MKLLHIPMPNPFNCHVFEVKEFPEDDDFVLSDPDELEYFITEVLNPNGCSPLLGIEVEKEDVEYIEQCFVSGIKRLKKSEVQ